MKNPSDEDPDTTASIEEVKWTDDSIRWEGGLNVKTSTTDEGIDDDDSDDDENYMVDPFADPDPFEIFPFQFEHPDNKGKSINVQIRGYKKDADEVWQSTGLTLWRASDYLCQYQMENMHLFQNKRTIELGAGLGLNGILAWRSTVSFPNSEVCITDGDSDALVHLRENVERNNQTTNDEDIGKVSCRQLIWGKDSSENFLERIANNQKYDVIIASDIIYAAVIVEPLWETIRALLKQPSDGDEEGGVFVMAYARRTNIPVTIEVVLKAAIENGFVYELVKEDDDDGIWVYTFHFGEGHDAK